jgi:hypothetical protein
LPVVCCVLRDGALILSGPRIKDAGANVDGVGCVTEVVGVPGDKEAGIGYLDVDEI